MKLTEYQQFPTKDGKIWFYMGLFHFPFTCHVCGKRRANVHEFLLYANVAEFEADRAINDFGRWFNNQRCGTECVKKFLAEIQ